MLPCKDPAAVARELKENLKADATLKRDRRASPTYTRERDAAHAKVATLLTETNCPLPSNLLLTHNSCSAWRLRHNLAECVTEQQAQIRALECELRALCAAADVADALLFVS